jgi:hypothetical protein
MGRGQGAAAAIADDAIKIVARGAVKEARPPREILRHPPLFLAAPADLRLRLNPKLQVAARRASVLFPNFPSARTDRLLGASRLQTLLEHLPQIPESRPSAVPRSSLVPEDLHSDP